MKQKQVCYNKSHASRIQTADKTEVKNRKKTTHKQRTEDKPSGRHSDETTTLIFHNFQRKDEISTIGRMPSLSALGSQWTDTHQLHYTSSLQTLFDFPAA